MKLRYLYVSLGSRTGLPRTDKSRGEGLNTP